MKTKNALLAVILIAAVAALPDGVYGQDAGTGSFVATAKVKPDNCYTCHQALGDDVSARYVSDIHYRKGISCSGCHGGNPRTDDMEAAMSAENGFLGVPTGDDISNTCQRCHSDREVMEVTFGSTVSVNQMEDIAASVHGKPAVSGKERMVQCTTCHDVHVIKSVKDQRSPVHPLNVVETCSKCHSNAVFMRQYNPGLPIDQAEKYKTSVHGLKHAKGDAKTAVCSSCHGSHDILRAVDAKSHVNAMNLPQTCGNCHADPEYMKEYSISTDQLDEYRNSVHGEALLVNNDLGAPSCNDCHGNHGAAPPNVESISKVCGTCHAINASLFAESPHKRAYDEMGLPECETCHGNHGIVHATDDLLGISENAVCIRCHSESDNPKGYAVAAMMRSMIDTLLQAEGRADSLVNQAEQMGMEVSESKFKLRDIRQARLLSRTMIHSFDEAKFMETVNNGIAIAGIVAGEGQESIEEYYFRRYGLGVATLIITIVAISLYVTIKRIEKRQAGKA